MTITEWITNDPAIAKVLRRIDRAYDKALRLASPLPISEKITAIRNARSVRDDAWAALRRDLRDSAA